MLGSKILEDTGIGKNFRSRILIVQEIITRINKGDYIQLKSFCRAKDTINRVKRKWTEGENFASYSFYRG